MQKPPPPIKSRRRRRYDERLAHLTARGGCVKKRRRLGPHLAPPYRRRPLCTEYGLSHALGACLGGRHLFWRVLLHNCASVPLNLTLFVRARRCSLTRQRRRAKRCMAAPQGRQSAASDCCGPGSCSGRQPAAQTLQVPASCTSAAAHLALLLSAAAACSANEPSASGEREEATVGALLLLQSSSKAPTATGHKRDTPASGPGGSATARKQGRPPRPKPSDMPPMRVINPISPGSQAVCGWHPLADPVAEPPLVVAHGEGERHAERHAERTAVAAPKQRQVRPISPEPAGATILKNPNTGFWHLDLFFPGQRGGQVVKNPLDHTRPARTRTTRWLRWPRG